MPPQITVLDAGGQYCHLIARKVRDLGVYADVAPSETPVSSLAGRVHVQVADKGVDLLTGTYTGRVAAAQ